MLLLSEKISKEVPALLGITFYAEDQITFVFGISLDVRHEGFHPFLKHRPVSQGHGLQLGKKIQHVCLWFHFLHGTLGTRINSKMKGKVQPNDVRCTVKPQIHTSCPVDPQSALSPFPLGHSNTPADHQPHTAAPGPAEEFSHCSSREETSSALALSSSALIRRSLENSYH